MNRPVLEAHSVAEAYLYLMATPCVACGRGPLRRVDEPGGIVPIAPPGEADDKESAAKTAASQQAVRVECAQCGRRDIFVFAVPRRDGLPTDDPLYPIINPTTQRSRILDVGQWITLFRVILEAASKESDKIEARRLGFEAAQCLEEAIRFYDDGELPAADAVYCESTRSRLRERPEQFAKRRLLDLRRKLPTLAMMKRHIAAGVGAQRPRRPWWKLW